MAHRRQVPWLERPASPRARCGVGPSVFSHPRPRLPGVAPAPAIRAGRPFSAASRRRSKSSPSTRISERRASPWPRRFADERLWSDATGRPVRPCITLTPTFRFRTRTTGSASTRPVHARPGDRTIAKRKLLLLGLAPLPAQVEAQERPGRMNDALKRASSAVAATPARDVSWASSGDHRAGVPVRHGRDLPAAPISRAPPTASERPSESGGLLGSAHSVVRGSGVPPGQRFL